jgi:hypothetical protein
MKVLNTHRTEKPPKYHNRKIVFLDIPFDSHKEANRYVELLFMERAGEIRNLELQPRYDLVVNGMHICSYEADFRYEDVATGLKVAEDVNVEDVKGFRTANYIIKQKLMKAVYGVEIVEI